MIPYSNMFQRPIALHLALLLPLTTFCGCCCPTVWYDSQAFETWAELQKSVHKGPPPATKLGDAEQTIEAKTGVTIHLPLLFEYTGQKPMKTLVPGTSIDGTPVPLERLQPYLVKDGKAVLIGLPGQKFAYEMQLDGQIIYGYLGVLPKGNKAYSDAKGEILKALKAVDPSVSWEMKTVGESGQAEYVEVISEQGFAGPKPFQPQQLPGKLAVYIVEEEHANVWVAYRGPTDLSKRIGLFQAAEASVATIKSKEPAAPITPGTTPGAGGNYVLAPNTQVELVPPPGYSASNRINGFQQDGTNATITVSERLDPYSSTIGTYDEGRRSNDIAEASRENVTIDGRKGTLMLHTQGGMTSWVLVFGDDTRTNVLTAALADPNDDATKQAVRSSLLTARQK